MTIIPVAKDTADFGARITKLFTDAHEWNSGNHPLETEMDLGNNAAGRVIGDDFNILSGDQDISFTVLTWLASGYLLYLNPLDADGNIIPETEIKSTNQ